MTVKKDDVAQCILCHLEAREAKTKLGTPIFKVLTQPITVLFLPVHPCLKKCRSTLRFRPRTQLMRVRLGSGKPRRGIVGATFIFEFIYQRENLHNKSLHSYFLTCMLLLTWFFVSLFCPCFLRAYRYCVCIPLIFLILSYFVPYASASLSC